MVNNLSIEVVYASETEVLILPLKTDSITIEMAIKQSGILEKFSEIDLTKNKVGVFSELKSLNDMVLDGDRIEIYRSLKIDPKQARRERAKKNSL